MWFQGIDNTISKWVLENLHGNDFINEILKFFTLTGEGGLIWILFYLGLLIYVIIKEKKVPVVLLSGAVALLLGWIINDFVLKQIIERQRPYLNVEAFGYGFKDFMDQLNYEYPTSYSFPSGHSFSSFNAALFICLYKKKLGFITLPIAAIIAFSRIFLGAHYFSDVLVGSLLGCVFAVTGYFVGNKILNSEKVSHSKHATR